MPFQSVIYAGKEERRCSQALQQVPAAETTSSAPLPHLQQMRYTDGSSLPLAEHLRWSWEL